MQRFPLAEASLGSGFPPPFLPSQKRSRRKEFSFLLISFLLLLQEEKMKRKTFLPFLFLFSIFSRSGRNGSILDFFLYLFSFFSEEEEKKRSRRRSFSPSLFSFSPFSFLGEKEEKKNFFFPRSFSLWEKKYSCSFSFFLLFQKEKEKEKRFLFLLFSLPFREEKSSSFFSSSEEEMRGEKWEKKEGERRRKRERKIALLGKFLLSYDIVFSQKCFFGESFGIKLGKTSRKTPKNRC